MKYTIILGFIATIPAVFSILSGNSGVQRVQYPQRWLDALEMCILGVSSETLNIFASYGKRNATVAAKCIALCVYIESGLFIDGKFDPAAIELFLREHIGPHDLLERTITMFKTAANAGNAQSGPDSDKAWAYHTTFGTAEHQRLWRAVFRPPEHTDR